MSDSKDVTDPVDCLGPDICRLVLAQLPPACLAKCLLVSTSWRELSESPELWHSHCKALWQDKRYVPEDIQRDINPKTAYARSIQDCQRTTITATELCSFAWTFKFKHQALDQHHSGSGNEMIRYFQQDGSYVIGENDCPYQHPRYRWQFLTHKGGRPGVCVQINRFPCLAVSRTPDWGWRMENPWVLFTSNPRRPAPAATPKAAACSSTPASTHTAPSQNLLIQ